jgi:GT2 family glycosyltransferase
MSSSAHCALVDEPVDDTSQASGSPAKVERRFSIVTVTYRRDAMLARAVDHLAALIGDRSDVEYILVDNNEDAVDRTSMLASLPNARCIKLGRNKGVAARNDGALAATGTFILFLDDDAMLHPCDALEVIETSFAGDERIAIVSARHIDARTGETPREAFPHTNKRLDKTRSFSTFRFQGNGFTMRRTAFQTVGPMSEDFLYGLEEIDYAYRVIDRGFKILYQPGAWVMEYNDSGGRLPRRDVEEMRLTNKLIISWKYLPLAYVPLNFLAFTTYVVVLNRGNINVLRSLAGFSRWASRNGWRRLPIGRPAITYIRSCGGAVWK